jgi:RNA polymerase sigma factor (sigma-70 family)
LELAQLVRAAGAGDREAWNGLVERLSGLVWSITRAHRLEDAEAADVVQTTWLRVVEQLDRVRDPERIAAWVATTARRECLHALRARRGQVALPEGWQDAEAEREEPAASLITAERDRELWSAFEGLSERCRALLRVLMADPAPGYVEVAAALDMPVGSIGPTRMRCLERLRELLVASGINPDVGASY